MKKRLPLFLIFSTLLVGLALAIAFHPKTFHPSLDVEEIKPEGSVSISILLTLNSTLKRCEGITANTARTILERCPQCRIKNIHCVNTLDDTQQLLLSDKPLPRISGRFAGGVIDIGSTSTELAASTCQALADFSSNALVPITCFPANTPRPRPHSQLTPSLWTLSILFVAFVFSALTGWLIVKYEHLHAHLSHDHVDSGPQKQHHQPTPRIGGLALMAGLLSGFGILELFDALPGEEEFALLLVSSTAAFIGGLIEDITKKVGVLERLFLTMISGVLSIWLLGAALPYLHIPGIDRAMLVPGVAVLLTVVAIGGIANAINIIDGYNGLSSGFSIIVAAAFSYIAYILGDALIFAVALALMGALLGFMVWNWPAGRIFLGDGGAYLVGFFLAELAVLLVVRNPSVSPWFPLAALIYPIFETLYSVYRRKFQHSLSPGQPDNKHLHQLIHHKQILLKHSPHRQLCRLESNNRVAKYFWFPALATAVLASIFWQSTPRLMCVVLAYCIIYIFIYRYLENPRRSQE